MKRNVMKRNVMKRNVMKRNVMKRNVMKRNIILVVTLFLGSLPFAEIHSMSRWARFKNYFTRKTPPRFKRIKQTKTTGKRFYSQMGKTARPLSRTKQIGLGAGGLFGGVTLWSWFKSWWSGEQQEIAKAMYRPDEILPLDAFGGGWNKPSIASNKNLENPFYLLLSWFGYRKFSYVVQEIAQKIEEKTGKKLSLREKKLLALYISDQAQGINTEKELYAYTSVLAVDILPALLYLHVLGKNNKVPESLIPKGTFYPVLYYPNNPNESPIINAFKKPEGIATSSYLSTIFLNSDIMKHLGIPEKNRNNFLGKLKDLFEEEEYKPFLNQNELWGVEDSFINKKDEKYNTASRYFSGTTRSAEYLTFGNPQLNEDWQKIYFGYRDDNQPYLYTFFTGDVKKLSITPQPKGFFQKEREITINPYVNVKENTIYGNRKLLNKLEQLVKEHQ
jgi:hypothetical protein